MTEASAAIAGIQTTLAALRGTPAASAASATTASASVFEAILESLTGSASSSAQDSFGQKLVDDARDYLGTPYVLGGRSKNGIDCSGLVKNVLETYGIDAPHHSGKQGELGTEVPSLAEAKPGDLIVLNDGHHIGIYAGDNKIIHAPSPGKKVVEQELWTGDAGIVTIRRIAAPASEAATPQIDLTQVLSGLAMLGNLSSLLGASALPSPFTPTALGASDLNHLQAQRWALLAKGIS